ncbi:Elongation factor Ts [Candidatus Arsenophonus lipoptenae]|uniref:Elongation factor Ts n=1 Tax=Candidatus Arsenophonus lipoptenae TaxID=634113 RepID=A0A0X9VQP7_9GAMM|nr:translation elongation factor Ts [Candidatus Arsenophonus lipoptenae]AMA64622.1 Elongation factor Ts [Candidatus Arsenophonus lipoptenae]
MFKITTDLVKTLRELTGVGVIKCKKALIEANGDIKLAINNMRKLGQTSAAKKAIRLVTEGVVIGEVSMDRKLGALIELNCETDFMAKNSNFLSFGHEILKFVILNKIFKISELKKQFEEQRIEMIAKTGENINIRRIEILEGEKIGCYLHRFRIGVLVSAENADDELVKKIAMHIAASKPEYITPSDIPESVISHEHQIQLDIAMKSGKTNEIAEKIVIGRMNKFINNICLTSQQFIMDQKKTVGLLLTEQNARVINFINFELGEGIKDQR